MYLIPQDLTDQDLYKFSMGQMAFVHFPCPLKGTEPSIDSYIF